MNRKLYWSMSLLIVLAMLLAACGQGAPGAPAVPSDDAAAETESTDAESEAPADEAAAEEMPSDGNPNESPALWAAVASGGLPPLADRLPLNPLVVEPPDEIGTYGGTLRHGSAGLFSYIHENMTRESLTSWEVPLANAGPPLPNIAESWEVSEDGTEVTVHLREGMKWSDGEPFTSEDIEFYWYDVMLDENATESMPNILRVDGEPPVLEVVDDFTIKFTYPKPYYFFAEAFATIYEIAWPKHYMEQFHPKYNEDATYEDLNANSELETGRGAVTLQAWMLDEWAEGEAYRLTRNPYYWKVDPEGNQLPYFDEAGVEIVEDRQSVALGNVTGDFDMDTVWVGVQHLQLFSEAIQDGRDISLTFADFAGMAQFFNFDNPDDVKRAALRDPSFRRAYSMTINRQEIGDIYYSGLLQPAGAVFSPVTPYYTEEDGQLWSQYDPDAANALLDEAGYADTDDDGFREAPDGSPLELIIDVGQHDLYTPIVELITTEYMPAIGIKTVMNVKDQAAIRDAYTAGDFDIHSWDFIGNDFPEVDQGDLSPKGPNTPPWHQNWETDPVSEEFLRLAELTADATTLPYDERVDALSEASHLLADNVWIVNTGFFTRPFIKSGRLGNAPDKITRNAQNASNPPFGLETLYQKYLPGEGP